MKEYKVLIVRRQTYSGKAEVSLALREELPEYVEKEPERLHLMLDEAE
ncbi:hypothetical protein FACS1894202_13440 [Clostridia bacterium]|nr:hypothetical protein FACS1894202_13440 [Clostridia bacterium]